MKEFVKILKGKKSQEELLIAIAKLLDSNDE